MPTIFWSSLWQRNDGTPGWRGEHVTTLRIRQLLIILLMILWIPSPSWDAADHLKASIKIKWPVEAGHGLKNFIFNKKTSYLWLKRYSLDSVDVCLLHSAAFIDWYVFVYDKRITYTDLVHWSGVANFGIENEIPKTTAFVFGVTLKKIVSGQSALNLTWNVAHIQRHHR